jgi:transcription antitermination factor NusB
VNTSHGSGDAASTRRTDTRDPRRARTRALKILFQADVRGEDPAELLRAIIADPRAWAMLDDLDPEQVERAEVAPGAPSDATADAERPTHGATDVPPIDGFTRALVGGVAANRDDLDALIQRYARRWSVARMPAIDRNALRLGAYELQHDTTSPAVVLNEVIELAKALSTDDSGRYVNGVLESVRKHLEAGGPVDAPDDLPPPPAPPAVPEGTLVAVEVPEPEPATPEEPAPDAWLADPEEDLGPEALATPDEVEDEDAVDPSGAARDEAAAAPSGGDPSTPGGAEPSDAEAELRAEHGELAAENPDEAAQQQLF